jgi:nitrogen fixation-related uncharacterized protein
MISSAGVDPWLEIENQLQQRLILENTKNLNEHVWISGNPRFEINFALRLFNWLGKIRMWHYPEKSTGFRLLKALLRRFVLHLPTKALMKVAFRKIDDKSMGARNGHRVEQNLPISMFVAGFRTVSTFEWALKNSQFDYLVRITSNCLVNERALLEFVATLPKERVYSGQIMNNEFMSGAALILSRDVVSQIQLHQEHLRYDVYEDVAIGSLIHKYNLGDFIPMKRVDYSSPSDVYKANLDEMTQSPVIRCKAESITQSPEKVLEVFRAVASRLGWA